jgi:hypothetical protein
VQDVLEQLMTGEIPYYLMGCDGLPEKAILMPGSFNPLHRGHEGLLSVAETVSGRKGVLELSIANVDKPPLSSAEVERRFLEVEGRYPMVLTCAPTFIEKAALFPGAWFAMGYDTAIRLLSPAYHDDVLGMLARFRTMGTRFVVAGRLHEGTFMGLEEIGIPSGFEELFVPIPEDLFREDVSSTGLRGD